MRVRLSVRRKVQLAEILICLVYFLVWAAFLLGWPGEDVAMPFLFAAGAGVAVTDTGKRVIDRLVPDRPPAYRRPFKAVAVGLLIVAILVVFLIAVNPLGPGASPRHQLLLVMMVCFAPWLVMLLWPPRPVEADPPPASASETQPSA